HELVPDAPVDVTLPAYSARNDTSAGTAPGCERQLALPLPVTDPDRVTACAPLPTAQRASAADPDHVTSVWPDEPAARVPCSVNPTEPPVGQETVRLVVNGPDDAAAASAN